MKGWNEEIAYKGARFHLQIQDLGPREPVIQALLYKSGRIIHSRRVSYAAHLSHPDLSQRIEAILGELHNSVIAEVRSGKFDHFLTPEEKQGSGGGC